MNKRKYIILQDTQSPAIFATGMGRHPHKVALRVFRKDKVVYGSIHSVKGKPAALMVDDIWVVPLKNVKELTVKDVKEVSSAEGDDDKSKVEIVTEKMSKSKHKYLDMAVVGAIVGFGITYFAGKKGWVNFAEPKTKYLGIGLGAAAGMFVAYRFMGKKEKTEKK